MQKLHDEIAQREQEREKSAKAMDRQRAQEAISNFKENITGFLTGKPDDFLSCATTTPESVDLIYDVIRLTCTD